MSAGTLNVAGTFSNYNQTTDVLTGGTYSVAGRLRFTGADIVTNQAAIVLDGSAAQVLDTVGQRRLPGPHDQRRKREH